MNYMCSIPNLFIIENNSFYIWILKDPILVWNFWMKLFPILSILQHYSYVHLRVFPVMYTTCEIDNINAIEMK